MALVEVKLPDKVPGERLAIKIWETTADNGIGGLLRPWQMRREGKALADVRRHEAQANRDAADIAAGRKTLDDKGNLIDCTSVDPNELLAHLPTLFERLRQVEDLRLLERAINIAATIETAAEEALSVADVDVSDKPVDPDWFTRWRANAEEVREEQMRRLWARILAGEVQRPGSFSLHTLEFMRRLSKEDAELIARLAPFITAERDLFPRNDYVNPILASNQLGMHELMELQNLGVLSGVDGNLTKNWGIRDPVLIRFRTRAIRVNPPPVAMLTLPIAGITKVGEQVMSLAKFEANEEYVVAIGHAILEQGFQVSIGNVREKDGGEYEVGDLKPLSRGPTPSFPKG